MGMKENPCAGYTVEAKDVVGVLPHEIKEQYNQAIEDGDWETIQNLLGEHWPEALPPFSSVFLMGDEDTPDEELEQGTIYVQFDQEDLYTLVPTPGLLALQKAGVKKPEYHTWSIWG